MRNNLPDSFSFSNLQLAESSFPNNDNDSFEEEQQQNKNDPYQVPSYSHFEKSDNYLLKKSPKPKGRKKKVTAIDRVRDRYQ